MSRPRLYANNAEKQAAYRARHADTQLPRQAFLAALARSLHAAMEEAVRAGHCPLPQELLHPRVDRTLQNLIAYLQAGPRAAAAPAPGSASADRPASPEDDPEGPPTPLRGPVLLPRGRRLRPTTSDRQVP